MCEKQGHKTSWQLRPSRAACSCARFKALSLQLAPPSPTREDDRSLLAPTLTSSLSSG